VIEIPSIVSWVLQNFSDLLPAKMVFEYERGVKFKKGKAVRKDLKSWIYHWYVPIQGQDRKGGRARAGRSAGISVSHYRRRESRRACASVIRYSIWSAWRFWVKIHDGYDSLYAATLGYIADAVTSATWEQLVESRSKLSARKL
jgi:hypothetical protein